MSSRRVRIGPFEPAIGQLVRRSAMPNIFNSSYDAFCLSSRFTVPSVFIEDSEHIDPNPQRLVWRHLREPRDNWIGS